jgi:hypothetical protein
MINDHAIDADDADIVNINVRIHFALITVNVTRTWHVNDSRRRVIMNECSGSSNRSGV